MRGTARAIVRAAAATVHLVRRSSDRQRVAALTRRPLSGRRTWAGSSPAWAARHTRWRPGRCAGAVPGAQPGRAHHASLPGERRHIERI